MKRKIAIGILVTYIPLCVAPFLGLDNEKKTENLRSNTLLINSRRDFREEMYKKVIMQRNISNAAIEKEENSFNEVSLNQEEDIQNENIEIYMVGYLNSDSNIRDFPSTTDGNIITTLVKSTQIEFSEYNQDWLKVKVDNIYGYIWKPLVSLEPINFTKYDVPKNSIKTFMPYTAITLKSSAQYKLQQMAYTGNYGIRQVDGRYCVALGSAYTTNIGQFVDLILANGNVIHCILADCKADKDTNSEGTLTVHDGSLVEFVVDSQALSRKVRYAGDISKACEEWESPVESIIVYEEGEILND